MIFDYPTIKLIWWLLVGGLTLSAVVMSLPLLPLTSLYRNLTKTSGA